jgi:hypothetical protein
MPEIFEARMTRNARYFKSELAYARSDRSRWGIGRGKGHTGFAARRANRADRQVARRFSRMMLKSLS